jgi:hypothetical protein
MATRGEQRLPALVRAVLGWYRYAGVVLWVARCGGGGGGGGEAARDTLRGRRRHRVDTRRNGAWQRGQEVAIGIGALVTALLVTVLIREGVEEH